MFSSFITVVVATFCFVLFLSVSCPSQTQARNIIPRKFFYHELEKEQQRHQQQQQQLEAKFFTPQLLQDQDVPYKLCGSNHIKLISLRASQWPIQKDSHLTFTANYELSDVTLTKGTYQAHVEFDGFPIYDKKGGLEEYGVQFPITPGVHNLTQTVHIPSSIPDGDIDITAKIFDQDNTQLLCINIQTETSLKDQKEKDADNTESRIQDKSLPEEAAAAVPSNRQILLPMDPQQRPPNRDLMQVLPQDASKANSANAETSKHKDHDDLYDSLWKSFEDVFKP